MRRKLLILAIGCVTAFIVTIVIDRVVGYVLNRSGYFKASVPGVTEVFDTSEFRVTTKISSQGIRNKEVLLPKPKNTYRILVVGDSFVYGWGVRDKETWISQLGERIYLHGKKVEIINAGLSGASPTEVRYVCRAYADQFEADAIIYGLYNDDIYQAAAREATLSTTDKLIDRFWPILSRMKYSIIATGNEQIPQGSTIEYRKEWVEMAKGFLQEYPDFLRSVDPRLHNGFKNGYISPWMMYFSYLDPDFIMFVLEDEFSEFAFRSLNVRLQKFRERCTGNRPTAVIYFPSKESVSEYYHPFSKQLGFRVDKKLIERDVDNILQPIVEKNNFKYVSVLSEFKKSDCKDCYFKYDRHLTAVGNKKAADVLEPLIMSWITGLQ